MTPFDFFSFAGGTLALLLTLHLSVFWVSRFLYPPQKPMIVVAPPVVAPPATVVLPPPTVAQPPLPDYTKAAVDLPSYVEKASNSQVPVINNEPLPPPISMAK
jgi:hypothetical protein